MNLTFILERSLLYMTPSQDYPITKLLFIAGNADPLEFRTISNCKGFAVPTFVQALGSEAKSKRGKG
jgi:hypothetical protein